jgi:hypothetical protein
MKKSKIILGISIFLYILVFFMVYSTNAVPEDSRLKIQYLVYVIAPIVTIILGIYAFKRVGIKSVHGRTILFILLGISFIMIGELVWTYLDFVSKLDYFFTADLFFLLAYPLFLAGSLLGLKIKDIIEIKSRLWISIIVMIALSAITIYIKLFSEFRPETTFFENIISLIHGFADIIILIAAIIMINLAYKYSGGFIAKFWTLLGIAFFIKWINDILFLLFYKQYTQPIWLFRQIDYLFLIQYALIASAFYLHAKFIDTLKKDIVSRKK